MKINQLIILVLLFGVLGCTSNKKKKTQKVENIVKIFFI
jgi:hypothetical protein